MLSTVNIAREKANDQYTSDVIHQYYNAFNLYYTATGHYPKPSGSLSADYCLDVDSCVSVDEPPAIVISTDAGLTSALSTYLSPLPKTLNGTVDYNEGPFFPKHYHYSGTRFNCGDANCDTSYITWAVKYPKPCAYKAIAIDGGGSVGRKCILTFGDMFFM